MELVFNFYLDANFSTLHNSSDQPHMCFDQNLKAKRQAYHDFDQNFEGISPRIPFIFRILCSLVDLDWVWMEEILLGP